MDNLFEHLISFTPDNEVPARALLRKEEHKLWQYSYGWQMLIPFHWGKRDTEKQVAKLKTQVRKEEVASFKKSWEAQNE